MPIKSYALLHGKGFAGNEQAFVDKIITHDAFILGADHRDPFPAFRDMIRQAKPDLPMLCYIQVATEIWGPDPFQQVMFNARDVYPENGSMFVVHADNRVPIFDPAYTGSAKMTRCIYDYRRSKWQDAFKAGIDAVLADFAWDGLFFDNCTVWRQYLETDEIAEDMAVALSNTLTDVATAHPNLLLVTNSRERWDGTHGGMLETQIGNPQTARLPELDPFTGQQSPSMQFYHYAVQNITDDKSLAIQTCTDKDAWLGVFANGNNYTVYSRSEYGL